MPSYGETEAADHGHHDMLNIAATRRPDWPALLMARGEIYELQANKLDQAIISYRKAIEVGSRDPQALFKLVMVLEKAHRLGEVELELPHESFSSALDLDVGKQLICCAMARRLTKAAMKMEGEKYLRPDSKDFRDQLMLGQLLLAGGRTSPEVEAAFRRAVALGEKQPEAWVGLVRYLGAPRSVRQGSRGDRQRREEARSRVTRQRWRRVSRCSARSTMAERICQQAVAEQPKSARVRRSVAEFLLRAGKPREAEPHFRLLVDGKLATAEDDIVVAAPAATWLALARLGDWRLRHDRGSTARRS